MGILFISGHLVYKINYSSRKNSNSNHVNHVNFRHQPLWTLLSLVIKWQDWDSIKSTPALRVCELKSIKALLVSSQISLHLVHFNCFSVKYNNILLKIRSYPTFKKMHLVFPFCVSSLYIPAVAIQVLLYFVLSFISFSFPLSWNSRCQNNKAAWNLWKQCVYTLGYLV